MFTGDGGAEFVVRNNRAQFGAGALPRGWRRRGAVVILVSSVGMASCLAGRGPSTAIEQLGPGNCGQVSVVLHGNTFADLFEIEYEVVTSDVTVAICVPTGKSLRDLNAAIGLRPADAPLRLSESLNEPATFVRSPIASDGRLLEMIGTPSTTEVRQVTDDGVYYLPEGHYRLEFRYRSSPPDCHLRSSAEVCLAVSDPFVLEGPTSFVIERGSM